MLRRHYDQHDHATVLRSISRAAIFESASSIWMVTGNLCLLGLGIAVAPPKAHIVGVVIGAAGMWICMLDTTKKPGTSHLAWMGDLAAILSGMGSSVYILLAEKVHLHFDPNVFFFIISVQYAVYCTIAACFLDSSLPEISFDPVRGYFAWMNPGNGALFLTQIWLSCVTDCLGNLGFITAMKYVPAVVVAAMMLLGPFIAAAEGMLVGVESAPGLLTVVGALVISGGCGIIAISENTSSQSITI